jgi:hypothetical protein
MKDFEAIDQFLAEKLDESITELSRLSPREGRLWFLRSARGAVIRRS